MSAKSGGLLDWLQYAFFLTYLTPGNMALIIIHLIHNSLMGGIVLLKKVSTK